MTDLERLRATRALIADKDNFTTIAMARNSKGIECASTSPEAARFCVVGAWFRIADVDAEAHQENYVGQTAARLLQEFSKLCGGKHIFFVNDTLGHKAVLKMLDDAIEKENHE
jgi:hypothetical protein